MKRPIANRRMVKKDELDKRVALLLGVKVKDVSAITEAFLTVTRGELVEMSVVDFEGLGQIDVWVEDMGKEVASVLRRGRHNPGTMLVRTTKKYRVSFRKSQQLTRALRARFGGSEVEEVPMEKYGVDEQQKDNEKVASKGCPECGAEVERHGNVISCPKHGTEPFEQQKNK